MSSLTEREPVAVAGAVTGFVSAALVAATAFGLELSEKQQAAVLGLLAAAVALAPVLSALWARRRVYAAENVVTALQRETVAPEGEVGPVRDVLRVVEGPGAHRL